MLASFSIRRKLRCDFKRLFHVQFLSNLDELKDLFTFHGDVAGCDTHELLACDCDGDGKNGKQLEASQAGDKCYKRLKVEQDL